MEKYFEIGQIVNTSGLKGVLKIKPFTDDINKFSISGFTFGQLGEQIVTATYDGCSYTSKVTTVEEKEDPHGGVK